MPNLIYIYSLENAKPKLLWAFISGDRAEGGLKNVYTENGKLLVELFGNNKFIQNKNEFEFQSEVDLRTGLCCPDSFSKFRFEWNGKKLEQDGETELFDYDRRNSK